MRDKALKAVLLSTVSFLLLLTAACGGSVDTEVSEEPEEPEEPETAVEVLEEAYVSLDGTWRSEPDEDGVYFELQVDDDGSLAMSREVAKGREVYWSGTWKETAGHNILAKRDVDTLAANKDTTRSFMYHDDDTLHGYYENSDGNTVGITMRRVN